MADVPSYYDRQHIKQVIKDAYNPAKRDAFPSSTPDKLLCQMAKDDTCPPGVDRVRLNIQCVLLPFFSRVEFYIFNEVYGHGKSLHYFAKYYHVHHQVISNMMDRMLDDAINKMSDGMAQSILSVYWQMHERDKVGGKHG